MVGPGVTMLLLLLWLLGPAAPLEVFAPPSLSMLLSHPGVLSCTFSVDRPEPDLTYLGIIWKFQKEEIVKYVHRKLVSSDPRMSLRVEDLLAGDASLYISSVRISDIGNYSCIVFYTPDREEKKITLKVQARPIISVSHKTIRVNTEDSLTCAVTGFFPPDIGVTWLIYGEAQKHDSIEKPQNSTDGTYRVTSTLPITVTTADRNRTFSCRVRHSSLPQPLQEDVQLLIEDEEGSSHVAVVICSILAAIIVIAVIIISYLWWKRNREDMFLLKDIEGPMKLMAGEEATLLCSANNCPENMRVTWLEDRGGLTSEIWNSNPGDPEDEERLLGAEYNVTTQRQGPNCSSTLRFRPQLTKHQDLTLICRFTCGNETQEKTFQCRVYARPRVAEPLLITMSEDSHIHFTLHLHSFYPKDMRIQWRYEDKGPPILMSANENISDQKGGTYAVTSEALIPVTSFMEPGFRVFVFWKHPSVEEEESRSLSVRDLPWKPQVGEIIVPTLKENEAATLTCTISDHFPDLLRVSWFLKKADNKSAITPLPNETYRVRDKTEKKETFWQSSLTFSPSVSRDQGAEFLCRVEHPSLERSVHKTTGPITISR